MSNDKLADLAFQLLAAANYIDALGGDSKSYRAALAAYEAEKQAGPDDTQRCIDARNRLNAALHGDGAVIDSLEHAVASVCAKLAEKQAGPVAHLWQHGETGRTRIVMPDQVVTADANWFIVGPLYLHPAPPSPLTAQAGPGAGQAAAPEPQISTEHGPWLPSQYDEGETYCKRCLTRSIFAGSRKCDPHIVYPPQATAPPSPRAEQGKEDAELPPMPESQCYVKVWIDGAESLEGANSAYYTAEQMQDYARAARAKKEQP